MYLVSISTKKAAYSIRSCIHYYFLQMIINNIKHTFCIFQTVHSRITWEAKNILNRYTLPFKLSKSIEKVKIMFKKLPRYF